MRGEVISWFSEPGQKNIRMCEVSPSRERFLGKVNLRPSHHMTLSTNDVVE